MELKEIKNHNFLYVKNSDGEFDKLDIMYDKDKNELQFKDSTKHTRFSTSIQGEGCCCPHVFANMQMHFFDETSQLQSRIIVDVNSKINVYPENV